MFFYQVLIYYYQYRRFRSQNIVYRQYYEVRFKTKTTRLVHSCFDFTHRKMSVVNVLVLLLSIIVLSERCASLNYKNDLSDNVNVPAGATKTEVCKRKLIRTIGTAGESW